MLNKNITFRGHHGGVEKRGGWKTSRMTPLPKRGCGPPRTVRFPPLSGVSALFFLYKNARQSRPEALLEGSKNFRESAFSGTFSSPHTFCTPPYHRPKHKIRKSKEKKMDLKDKTRQETKKPKWLMKETFPINSLNLFSCDKSKETRQERKAK